MDDSYSSKDCQLIDNDEIEEPKNSTFRYTTGFYENSKNFNHQKIFNFDDAPKSLKYIKVIKKSNKSPLGFNSETKINEHLTVDRRTEFNITPSVH